jgi:hypothetical protein
MSVALNCSSCTRSIPIDLDGRLPPWCRHCGATLSRNAVPQIVEPASTPLPPVEQPKPSEPRAQAIVQSTPIKPRDVPFFQAVVPQVLSHERLRGMRFYVVNGELLVFPSGLGSIRDGQYVPQTHISRVPGGIGHGAHQISYGMRQNDMNSIRENGDLSTLAGASEAAISEAARTIFGAAAIEAEDIGPSRIESTGTWFALTRGFSCAAVLKLGYPGFKTLALPSISDARRAVGGLRSLIGDQLVVDLPWGSKR